MSLSTTKPDLSSKRRRFQPPITTFFSTSSHPSSNGPSSVSYNHYSALTHSPTPVVPAKIQASLLSVGMRVRKSVAEGYRTHHAKAIDEKHTTTTTSSSTREEKKRTYSVATRSELAPFSGMGRSSQYTPYPGPSTYQQLPEHTITTDEDAFSLAPSSQESVDSQSYSAPPPPPIIKKRTHTDFDFDFEPYEDEDGINLDFTGMDDGWQDSPRLHPFHGAGAAPGTNLHGRTILSPTLNQQRRRFLAAKHKPGAGNPMDVDDFEEPAFLRRREEVEMDVVAEVQMGGM
ncbi:ribonucleotide reductase inhibitor-domain-containing protein [Aspergillus granulosus]|uniref:Ribonucleotide reductase inhibitor-domain-containing protein n=1 Tax=Aspergillus granulosus TaxID=176169 RepID=A0ABR4HSI6_9EURO